MAGVTVAIASCCDEPVWATECINKFKVAEGVTLEDCFTPGFSEIYKGNKKTHLTAIKERVGCDFTDIMFLDNQLNNCRDVCSLGVTVVYTPSGVTAEDWDHAMERFPAPGEILRT